MWCVLLQEFIKKRVSSYFTEHGKEATVKYIDPSYMIRCVRGEGRGGSFES